MASLKTILNHYKAKYKTPMCIFSELHCVTHHTSSNAELVFLWKYLVKLMKVFISLNIRINLIHKACFLWYNLCIEMRKPEMFGFQRIITRKAREINMKSEKDFTEIKYIWLSFYSYKYIYNTKQFKLYWLIQQLASLQSTLASGFVDIFR